MLSTYAADALSHGTTSITEFFPWQIIFKSLEISEMTILNLSGQFIGLI